MPSDPTPVFLPLRCTAVLATAILICLCVTLVSAAEASKKKTAKPSKPVFSVSTPESAAAKPAARPTQVPMPSKGAAPDSAPAGRKSDTTAHHTAAVSAAVKDSTPRAPLWEASQPVVLPEQKKAADTVSKDTSVSAAFAPAKASVSLKKHKPLKRTLLFRIVFFLGSMVVIVFAIRFVKKQKAAPRFLTTTRLSVMDKEVQRACRYIEKNFADPDLSLKKICLDLVTGEAFLEALMHRDLGVTVNDFIMHVRINKAKQILDKDPLAAGDAIARETGFASGAAFLAVFKRLTGIAFEDYTQNKGKSG
jgi:AraC-like DNA-binding protein